MDEYLVNQVMTASPQQLHLMVVDGCLRHARLAADAIAEQDFDRSHDALTEARTYLTHLLSGLNPEADDEFMVNLRGLFKLAFRQMTLADIERDGAKLAPAIDVLAEHRATWKGVMDALAADATAIGADAVALSA